MAETEQPRRRLLADRYEVLRPLGRGGMGKVFLVRDIQTDREVALKMLRSQWQSRKAVVARFLREIETAQRLNHPCIVKIFDTYHDDDYLFYTMEYLDGKSLRAWMKQRGQLSFGSAVRVLSLVAHALEHAHQFTIHRDLSPENIMVLPDGTIRLLDFGLAKLEDANQGLTMVGTSLGKLQYVAPEQQRNAADVDHRADLYPLGVMLFEMLTGQLPDARHHLSDHRPELPQELNAFVEKAMAADRDARFQTAREFRKTLVDIYERSKGRAAQPAAPPQGGPQPDAAAFQPLGFFARLRLRVRNWFRR